MELLLALHREGEVVGRADAHRARVELRVLEARDERSGPALLVTEDEVPLEIVGTDVLTGSVVDPLVLGPWGSAWVQPAR